MYGHILICTKLPVPGVQLLFILAHKLKLILNTTYYVVSTTYYATRTIYYVIRTTWLFKILF